MLLVITLIFLRSSGNTDTVATDAMVWMPDSRICGSFLLKTWEIPAKRLIFWNETISVFTVKTILHWQHLWIMHCFWPTVIQVIIPRVRQLPVILTTVEQICYSMMVTLKIGNTVKFWKVPLIQHCIMPIGTFCNNQGDNHAQNNQFSDCFSDDSQFVRKNISWWRTCFSFWFFKIGEKKDRRWFDKKV